MSRLLFVLLLVIGFAAHAVEPREMMSDPALEARAREVSKALRCVVCQNETIDDSNAELARDMRLMVRERIAAGDSNKQVLDYMVARYGDFVLLKPRFTGETIVLWIGPFIVLVLGAIALARTLKRRAPTAPLSAEESAALARLDKDAP